MSFFESHDLIGGVKSTDPLFGIQLGESFLHTHPPTKCSGEFCCVHNPSDHHMAGWQMNWRADTMSMERLCPHGVGHPDPDDVAHQERMGRREVSHGCDGCCDPPLKPEEIEAAKRSIRDDI